MGVYQKCYALGTWVLVKRGAGVDAVFFAKRFVVASSFLERGWG
jgi:hypothetical protein